jgi:peptidyl-prolyl cis-trans isomerase C
MKSHRFLLIVIVLSSFLFLASCKPKEQEVLKPEPEPSTAEVAKVAEQQVSEVAKEEVQQIATAPAKAESKPAPPKAAPKPAAAAPALAVEVNSHKMTQRQLQRDVDNRFEGMKASVPKGKEKEARDSLRSEIINDFILRSVLADEARRMKIVATPKEIDESMARFQKSLPEGVSLNDVLKMNRITKEQLRSELELGIRVGKIIQQRTADKKPKDPEIAQFYEKNIESFRIPESAKARHILIASARDDDEKKKTEKKAKAEEARKKLLAGDDFAKLAAELSDCPSKNNGGDLGSFSRGQMVKEFEDAAFALKKGEISPVVETTFGYHIIQLLEHEPARTLPLDEEQKTRISNYLHQEVQRQDFMTLIEDLRKKAKIVIH